MAKPHAPTSQPHACSHQGRQHPERGGSKIQVLGLPKNRDRKLLTMDYRPDSPEAKALRATQTIKYCKEWGRVFVVQPGDRFSTCPAFRGTKERKHILDMFG